MVLEQLADDDLRDSSGSEDGERESEAVAPAVHIFTGSERNTQPANDLYVAELSLALDVFYIGDKSSDKAAQSDCSGGALPFVSEADAGAQSALGLVSDSERGYFETKLAF
jgi:hypothetical protein